MFAFGGKAHWTDAPQCPLLTQSGHGRPKIAAVQTDRRVPKPAARPTRLPEWMLILRSPKAAGAKLMDLPSREFVLAGSLEELKAKGRLVLHGTHRPILVIYDKGRVFALDNRCPHMGFPLERGSVEDGILTCHWHHARFDLESGCTFDLWADDVPICPVEVRNGELCVKTTSVHADP